MIPALLNFAVAGLVIGAMAAMAVALLAMRWPRFAATCGTLAFPLVALAPLLRDDGSRVSVDHRGLEQFGLSLCVLVSAVVVAREVSGHLALMRERRRWRPASTALRHALGVQALFVDPNAAPSTHGVFSRAIVIPHEDVAEAVLLHERAHFEWRDPAATAVRRLIRAVLWMHPGLTLLERVIVQASELAADAAALRSMSAPEFASALVAAARSSVPGAAFGGASAAQLEERVRAILGSSRRRLAVLRAAVLALALAAVPFVPQFVQGGDDVVIRRVVVIR